MRNKGYKFFILFFFVINFSCLALEVKLDSSNNQTKELIAKISIKNEFEEDVKRNEIDIQDKKGQEFVNSSFLLDVIKYLSSWPIILLIISIIFRKGLLVLMNRTKTIKVADFQFNLQEIAESSGISNISENLKGLNYEELRLFYILCGDNSDRFIFDDTGKKKC